MEQEKDNFWMYIAGVILFAVVFVFVMKSEKTSMEPGVNDMSAQAESKAEVEAAIARNHAK